MQESIQLQLTVSYHPNRISLLNKWVELFSISHKPCLIINYFQNISVQKPCQQFSISTVEPPLNYMHKIQHLNIYGEEDLQIFPPLCIRLTVLVCYPEKAALETGCSDSWSRIDKISWSVDKIWIIRRRRKENDHLCAMPLSSNQELIKQYKCFPIFPVAIWWPHHYSRLQHSEALCQCRVNRAK